ncbi:MAG TPA: hypothetical protein PLW95_06400 [bacterium]|nr:hypothetical protein [bacterium]
MKEEIQRNPFPPFLYKRKEFIVVSPFVKGDCCPSFRKHLSDKICGGEEKGRFSKHNGASRSITA